MYVTLATIAVATREAAAPTRWELLCCKNNKHWMAERRGRSSEREYSKDRKELSKYRVLRLLDGRQAKSLTPTVCSGEDNSMTTKPNNPTTRLLLSGLLFL